MFCPKCGRPLEKGAKFCPSCGTKIPSAVGTSAAGVPATRTPAAGAPAPSASTVGAPTPSAPTVGMPASGTSTNATPTSSMPPVAAFQATYVAQSVTGNSRGSFLKTTKGKIVLIAVAVVVVVLIVVIIACARGCSNKGASSTAPANTTSAASQVATSQATTTQATSPENVYQINRVLALGGSGAATWTTDNQFAVLDQDPGSAYRYLIDGTVYPADASSLPSNGTDIALESYMFLNDSLPTADNIEDLFTNMSLADCTIDIANLASSTPCCIEFGTMTNTGISTSQSTEEVSAVLLPKLGLGDAMASYDASSSYYCVGRCSIGDKDGIWLSQCKWGDNGMASFNVYCGYASNMCAMLGIDDSDDSLKAYCSATGTSTTADTTTNTVADTTNEYTTNDYTTNDYTTDTTTTNDYTTDNTTTITTSMSYVGTWTDPTYGDTLSISSDGTATVDQGSAGRSTWNWSENSSGITLTNINATYQFIYSTSGGVESLTCAEKGLFFER